MEYLPNRKILQETTLQAASFAPPRELAAFRLERGQMEEEKIEKQLWMNMSSARVLNALETTSGAAEAATILIDGRNIKPSRLEVEIDRPGYFFAHLVADGSRAIDYEYWSDGDSRGRLLLRTDKKQAPYLKAIVEDLKEMDPEATERPPWPDVPGEDFEYLLDYLEKLKRLGLPRPSDPDIAKHYNFQEGTIGNKLSAGRRKRGDE